MFQGVIIYPLMFSTRLTVPVPTRIAFCVSKSRTKWHFVIAVLLAASAYCHVLIYHLHCLLPANIYFDDRPDALGTTSPRRSRSSPSRIVHMTREETSMEAPRSDAPVESSLRHVVELDQSSEVVDETQLLPMLDSTDVAHASVFRRQSFPYPDEECVPYHAWQTESFTTCNVLHELDLNSAFVNLAWHKRGGRHYTWRVLRGDRDLAMRTVRFDKNFTESDRESTRIDHLAMERLTSSNYTLDLYGYCGGTTLTEFATGKEMCALRGRGTTDRRKLDYAIDIARGYVDLQSIDCGEDSAPRMESLDGTYAVAAGCNATIVHQDASCSNYLLGDDGRLKLHDFNVGRLLYWNPKHGRPCGYRNMGQCGEKGLPRVNSKSPEECRNEGMTEKVDTFAFGSALFELLTGRPPYQAVHGEEDILDTEEIRRRILEDIEPELPMPIPVVSKNATDASVRAIWLAMKKARGFDAEDRPNMREIANFLILERAEIAKNEATTKATSPASDEEKKALIIEMQRELMRVLCSQAGTQDPLFYLHPNADGSGSITVMWESEAAAVKSLLLAIDDGTTSTMTYEQQKRFVLHNVAKSHEHPGVNYTIMEEGTSPRMAKAVLTYPTYRQLLDNMYPEAKMQQQQMQQQQMLQQQMQQQPMQQQPMQHMDATAAQIAAMRKVTDQHIMMQQQSLGLAPTHYENGIPHYSGGLPKY